jgi:hypothetical protein
VAVSIVSSYFLAAGIRAVDEGFANNPPEIFPIGMTSTWRAKLTRAKLVKDEILVPFELYGTMVI